MQGNRLKLTTNNVCNNELSFTRSPVTLFLENTGKFYTSYSKHPELFRKVKHSSQ